MSLPLRHRQQLVGSYDRQQWEFGGVRHAAANSLTLKAMKFNRLHNLLGCKYFHTAENHLDLLYTTGLESMFEYDGANFTARGFYLLCVNTQSSDQGWFF